MCTFIFQYEGNVTNHFENINKVSYVRGGSNVVVDNQSLLTHAFPIGYDLHLFSDTSNFTVSGKNLVYIEVRKEN